MPLPKPPADGKSFRVLVVEDDVSIGKLILINLRKAGFDGRYAYDGTSGWESFTELSPHLVLSDISMPGMTGHELAVKIRSVSTVPIILMTAIDTDERQMRGFKSGADDYIAKPFNPQLLMARVIANLRRVYRYGAAEEVAPVTPEPASDRRHDWPVCGACGYMAPPSKFEAMSASEGRILQCPNCRSRNLTFPVA